MLNSMYLQHLFVQQFMMFANVDQQALFSVPNIQVVSSNNEWFLSAIRNLQISAVSWGFP